MNKIDNTAKKIDEILDRGVIADILPSKEAFRELLLSGKRLKMYLGIDPTSISLHLGHAENIMVLEDFRALGHEIVLLVGDFTAKVGDPSERSSGRTVLSDKEIKKNTESIIKQLDPLLDFKSKENPPKLEYNSTWLSKLNFGDLLELASNFTVQQMIERDMFKKRIANEKPVFLQEFLYPLMQGYDSVALDTDVEVGGTDQTFNMLAGRTLLKKLKNKEKFIITNNLIENPKTKELMSKSRGTGVFIDSSPNKMFGEIMSQPDEMVEILFINTTRVPLKDVKDLIKEISSGGQGAKNAKLRLAEEIVNIYHSKEDGKKARDNFISTFSKKEIPSDLKEYAHLKKIDTLLNIVSSSGLSSSRSDARRLIDGGAIEINGETKKDGNEDIDIKEGLVLKVGKYKFIKIVSS